MSKERFDWQKHKPGSQEYSEIKSAYYNPRFTVTDIAKEFNTTARSLHHHFDREKREAIKEAYFQEVEELKKQVGEPVNPFGKQKPRRFEKPIDPNQRPQPVLTPTVIEDEPRAVINADKADDASLAVYGKSMDLMLRVLHVVEKKIDHLEHQDAEDVHIREVKEISNILKDCNLATKDQKDATRQGVNLAVLVNTSRQKDLKIGKRNTKKMEQFIEVNINEQD